MAEQMILLFCLLVMPMGITASNEADLEAIKQEIIQIEIDTRAFRQKKSGHGL